MEIFILTAMFLLVFLSRIKLVRCNEDIFAEKIEGIREKSVLYVIEDNIYTKERTHQNMIVTRCMHFKLAKKHCKARANIDQDSLLVITRSGEHTCEQDPSQRIQIMMEGKMKNLAGTTGDSIRKIYDDVSLENPEVAARIPFPRLEAAMRKRREKTTPINPTNFVQCVELLQGSATYNKHLQHVIQDEGEGAMIFATPKGLALANSPEIKVSMTDATFQCCPRKQNTGIYQLFIFHVMRCNHPIPILHTVMTNKKETLYTEVMEWIKEQCPLLNPQNISMDFELAEMNSAKAVFDIDPTGCDFHYNQAILRKIGKKGLKKMLRMSMRNQPKLMLLRSRIMWLRVSLIYHVKSA